MLTNVLIIYFSFFRKPVDDFFCGKDEEEQKWSSEEPEKPSTPSDDLLHKSSSSQSPQLHSSPDKSERGSSPAICETNKLLEPACNSFLERCLAESQLLATPPDIKIPPFTNFGGSPYTSTSLPFCTSPCEYQQEPYKSPLDLYSSPFLQNPALTGSTVFVNNNRLPLKPSPLLGYPANSYPFLHPDATALLQSEEYRRVLLSSTLAQNRYLPYFCR